MSHPEDLMRLEDRFNVKALHYLGGESRPAFLAQADVLLEGNGFTLPAHRCILTQGSKVCREGQWAGKGTCCCPVLQLVGYAGAANRVTLACTPHSVLHMQVLAMLFESVPPAPAHAEPHELPAKRQRTEWDHGGGSSWDAAAPPPPAGTLAACTRLSTPFLDYSKPAVLLLLHLLYNSHRAMRVARYAVGQPALVSEVRMV